MECWTQDGWRTPQHRKSRGWDKQADYFEATFPNFMTLTNEERQAFFQTLYAAKVKLENRGVTVKPFFGTVHDQSWNSDASDNVQDDGYISQVSKTPVHNQRNLSSGSFGGVSSVNSIRSESSERILKEDELFGKYSEEVLGRNESLESLGFDEKEVEITNFHGLIKNMMILPKSKPLISSLSYEILNKADDASNYQQQKENTLKIKGAKLKVQVTLTSGDNERMRISHEPQKPHTNDAVSGGFTRAKIFPAENKKKSYDEDEKSVEEHIDDPELKDLLNVENDSEDLSEEEEKPLFKKLRKRSSEVSGKEIKSESDLDKAEGKKIEVENRLLFNKGTDREETFQELSETRLIGEKKPKKEQNDKEILKINSNVSIASSFEFKDDAEAAQQRILEMTPVKEGSGSSTKLEMQEAEAKDFAKREMEREKRVEKLRKCLQKRELEYQNLMRRKNELKAQREKRLAELKKDNESHEEVKMEKNPECTNLEKEEMPSATKETKEVGVCTEEVKEEKHSGETEVVARSDSAQVGDAVGAVGGPDPAQIGDAAGGVGGPDPTQVGDAAGGVRGPDPAQVGDAAGGVGGPDPAQIGDAAGGVGGPDPTQVGDAAGGVGGPDPAQVGDAAGGVGGPDPAQIGDAAGGVESSREEKALDSTRGEGCVTPFKAGKVVFVNDNVIDKIRNVIVDLDKHAKGEDSAENEYLVLLVDYVEYLTNVTATLFEKRIKNQFQKSPRVRFDEENLEEIRQIFRASTSTSDDELDYNEELEIRKKRKKNKRKKASFIKRLRRCFRCCKSKKKKKAGSSSSGSSR